MKKDNYSWFECRIRYDKTMDDGTVKNTAETYLLAAGDFTEAEQLMTVMTAPEVKGDFMVDGIKRAAYNEVFTGGASMDEGGGRYFKLRLTMPVYNDEDGLVRADIVRVLVESGDLRSAIRRLEREMKQGITDYDIVAAQETPLSDVFTPADYPEKK